MIKQNKLDNFGARSAYLTREWLVSIQTPVDGVKPLVDALSGNIPLIQGRHDQCLYVTSPGQQRFHAVADSHAGLEHRAQSTLAVEVTFSIPQDPELLDRVFETVFDVHCNEDPTIRILETWGSRSDYLDDRNKANRHWHRADARTIHGQAVANVHARSA
ncbi:MAG: hypothetical protein OEN20_07465 [Gammaproteobacteria bacterium]|nr:hypothetical protein [Gammaproteobacteria bacterium]